MPAQPYEGRRRAPSTTTRPSRGLSVPGAAAAALTLTATGAAVAPSFEADAASATTKAPEAKPAKAAPAFDAAAERAKVTDARASIAQASAEIRAERAAAQARAARAAERKAAELKRKKALQDARRWVLPAVGRFTSDYGQRWGRLHAGIDIAAPIGTRIGALSSGTVVFAGPSSGYGNKVEIRHWDGTVSYYGHMSSIDVSVGQKVSAGEKIGEVGNTGRSTGPHLHLEIHPGGGAPVDPAPWLLARGVKVG